MILTVPNIISFIRLGMVPVFLWLLFGKDDPTAAGILIGVVGSTDWVDGYLARRLGQVSALGAVLDPVADRAAVGAAVIGGWVAGILAPWFAAALIAREVVVAVIAGYVASRARTRLEVRYIGKLSTFILYFAFPAFYLAAGTGWSGWSVIGWVLAVPGLALYWVAAAHYAGDARRLVAAQVSSASDESGEPG